MARQNQHVFTLSNSRDPLMPCHPARARELLRNGEATVFRRYPFTIILKNREDGDRQTVALKIDPGSKATGLALVVDGIKGKKAIWGAELQHRGGLIKARLDLRRLNRDSRRNHKLRNRPMRSNNRKPAKGWLPPSLMHRVFTINTWTRRLRKAVPIYSLSQELVKFDPQRLDNPEITGIEYQHGELDGYEIREYLLEKFDYSCIYCGTRDTPLEVEHIQAKSKGGTNRLSNLTLACNRCNTAKGSLDVRVFLADKPDILNRLITRLKAPMRDAEAVNTTRWKLLETLLCYGLPLERGTGGMTKFNRTKQGYKKAHWVDAVCVGETGSTVRIADIVPLQIKATGRGVRQMCQTNKFGFPVRHRTGVKTHYGFRTGDFVKASIPVGKSKGRHTGRITVRSRPCFTLKGFDVHPKYLTKIQRADGYQYTMETA